MTSSIARVARPLYEFVVGDDWLLASGALAAIAAAAGLAAAGAAGWIAAPVGVVAALAWSLRRATRGQSTAGADSGAATSIREDAR
jgi:hypothetical protein